MTISIGSLQAPAVTSILTSYGAVGAAYRYAILATNSAATYGATGLSGTGLTLNTTTGVISGTPTASGTFPITLTATNATGTGAGVILNLQILSAPSLVEPEYIIHRLRDGSVANEGYKSGKSPARKPTAIYIIYAIRVGLPE